ncbi:hypothetical protein H1P_580003 [Hyella patelloides LEGE 07179]|uniref:Uncharacterized protein n=1 Tax=Hyella patelloides LEGE 07179 TaxID=945734 RepID=A0A563W0Q7_9CYAN|nr:hypothetical protein H1P_580003 [Hyella patelloides LEGE 07179]
MSQLVRREASPKGAFRQHEETLSEGVSFRTAGSFVNSNL